MRGCFRFHWVIKDERAPAVPQDAVDLIDGVVPHHEMALRMADMEIAGGSSPEVIAVAERMRMMQMDEIAELEALREIEDARCAVFGWHVACWYQGMSKRYPLHCQSEVEVPTTASLLFSHLDDHRRLSGHMEKPSWMMLGATMHLDMDALEGRAVGSHLRIVGRVLGLALAVEEVVTEREPPLIKVWETLGEPRLLMIGAYRMGFRITPRGDHSHLIVSIDYQLPSGRFTRWLGRVFGRAYARWCTRRVALDAEAAFARSGVRNGPA
jgi:hypothetical protein